jgi:hypothetical protein
MGNQCAGKMKKDFADEIGQARKSKKTGAGLPDLQDSI